MGFGWRKGMSSLLLLAVWELWNKQNVQVFKNLALTPAIVLAAIQRGAALWTDAGTKGLSIILPQEYAFVS
jgi:hypothetical protein